MFRVKSRLMLGVANTLLVTAGLLFVAAWIPSIRVALGKSFPSYLLGEISFGFVGIFLSLLLFLIACILKSKAQSHGSTTSNETTKNDEAFNSSNTSDSDMVERKR